MSKEGEEFEEGDLVVCTLTNKLGIVLCMEEKKERFCTRVYKDGSSKKVPVISAIRVVVYWFKLKKQKKEFIGILKKIS